MLRFPVLAVVATVLLGVVGFGPVAGATVEPADVLYVSNNYDGRVLQVTADGVVSEHAQTGGTATWGVAFDPDGNLYVAVTSNNTVERITPEGVRTVFATTGAVPSGIACDADGNVHVAVTDSNHVMRYTPAGAGSVFASGGLSYPTGLAFDGDGNLYVANGGGGTISRFSPSGSSLGTFASTGGSSPYGLAFDADGDLYVANNGSGTVWRIDPAGNGTQFCEATGAVGLAFGGDGTLYVTQNTEDAVRSFAPDGTDLGTIADAGDGLGNPMFLAISTGPQDPEPPTALENVQQALGVVQDLPASDFDTRGHQVALGNWLEEALEALEASDTEEAVERLAKAMARTDGCTLRGSADAKGKGADWIVDCDAAEAVYALLAAALDALAP